MTQITQKMTIKALSIKQPWAGMIAAGLKTIETRTWWTAFRGPLLLVASQKPVYPDWLGQCGYCLQFSERDHFDVLGADPEKVFCNICGRETQTTFFDASVSGKALCIVDLVDCRVMSRLDVAEACCEIYPDAHSWILKNIQPVTPFAVKGQLRLFDVQLPDGIMI